ncbi:hypothetical protein BU23DRAFT_526976 [Bimuria novae-zelandiae CBS 107.79]|uniref:Cep57 centrosome microtubule-binding domain-containing protein n=1 Tax=Bimuria novae-zelandiae CBS 107.79 TaxID=1447943 RepID=A0A6A5VP64_9PLEO|nr:hypothetical protein BU23DRAFT_526976 [Bimuria novae-zelandiae CBS 107.79]
MQSSPPHSDGKARAIRELSQSLIHNHSQRSISSVHSAPSESNPTRRSGFGDTTDDFFNNPDVLMSTQHNIDDETNTLPKYPRIRSTAKKATAWRMPQSEPNPNTSMVNKEFGDFDQSISDEEIESIEQVRGDQGSNRGTPAKMSSRGFDSLYDITPPTGRSRKSYAAETGSLRRDAQIRRASRNDIDNGASPRPGGMRNSPALSSKQERKRTSLAKLHAKLSEDESSFMQERPPTATFQHSTSTRWGNPRSRQASLQVDGNVDASQHMSTTPRSRPVTAQNPTAQSFILPDLPNLTELVSGVFEDGTPVFSKNAPMRSRFVAPSKGGNGGRQPAHIPVDSVPIPKEEKAIFAALQLLQDKVAQMEHERAEQEKKIEDQELEIIELKATAQAQAHNRGRDSALGSTDGEGSGKASWRVEKTRLDATVQTLRTKLDRTERKIAVVEIEKKRLNAERDNMASQLGMAFQTCEELKGDKQALAGENDALRGQIDMLRAEIEQLRDELEHEQAQHREETAELHHVRAQQDEQTQQLARKEAELRKARQEQVEYARLQADHEALRTQLASLKAKREADLRRWSDQEASLKKKVERRDETIRHFQDNTQEQTNEAMRLENQRLREELAQEAAQHEQDNRLWAEREQELNHKITRRASTARHTLDMTREILSLREANGQPTNSRRTATVDQKNIFDGSIQRKPSHRREENTRTRIRSRVQEESRASRANASFHSSHIEESPRKTYISVSKAFQPQSLPTETNRSVSAPLIRRQNIQEVGSDAESTTDLSLAPRATSYQKHSGFSAKPSTATVQPPPDLDYTELSFISGAAVAELRRQLEEERAAMRSRSVSAPREPTLPENTVRSEKAARDDTIRSERAAREDTVRSAVSEKSVRQPSLPRKSSMKDVTKTNTTQFEEDMTGNVSDVENATGEANQTDQSAIDASMLSNTSRRRRSVPTEMTSAFIIPDLTLGARRQSTTKNDFSHKVNIKQHDNENCTVCRRDANPASDSLRVPKLVPVSSRMPDDADATMRPARSPKEALALVVKELSDERIHLHAELAVARAMLESHDPSLGRKKRAALESDIADLLARIKVKDDQIYNLYDVLEGQQEGDITEQFVEGVTEEIRQQDEAVEKEKEKRRKKRVTIQSFHEDEESSVSGEVELPWEGFEDTGEVTGQAGRIGVY